MMQNFVSDGVAELKVQLTGFFPTAGEKDVVPWSEGEYVVYTTLDGYQRLKGCKIQETLDIDHNRAFSFLLRIQV